MMPIFLRIKGYKIYFWSNESKEPVHFHIAKGDPSKDDTKMWVKKDHTVKLAHNKGHVPDRDLMKIMILMQSYAGDYIQVWKAHLGYVTFIG